VDTDYQGTGPVINGPFVETITGPVGTADLGFTLMHEHIIVKSEGVAHNWPQVWDMQPVLNKALETLTALKAKGIDTLVDVTVWGLGREIPPLAPIVRKAGIHVIVAAGLYTFNELPYYFRNRDVSNMADLFVADITEGIQGTDIKAGILKCTTSIPGITEGIDKLLRATAQAHLRTGVPVSTHSHAASKNGVDQQNIFEAEGVDLRRVIIGHCGDTDDLDYLTKLIERGSYIGMDRFGIGRMLPEEDRIATVAKLCRMGYAERMVISHDAMVYYEIHPPGGMESDYPDWNYFHIIDKVIPALLEAGVSREQIDVMTRENPRRIFENKGAY
jgi:phosphotriesterase-related protein